MATKETQIESMQYRIANYFGEHYIWRIALKKGIGEYKFGDYDYGKMHDIDIIN